MTGQGIDRDALADLQRATNALALMLPGEVYDDYRQRLDHVLALVLPVEGVVLSREEVEIVLGWKLIYGPNEDAAEGALESRLGAWLEAAQ